MSERIVVMRITGGRCKGQSIRVAVGKARYTSSKVRKAIFDRIGTITGMTVLDLFAGSGSFSVEAMSRGAIFWARVVSRVSPSPSSESWRRHLVNRSEGSAS